MDLKQDRRKNSSWPPDRTERRLRERRSLLRVAAEILVVVASRGTRTYRRTANLSAGGLAFHSPIPQGTGTRLELILRTAPGRDIRVAAEVVGANASGRGTRVRFLEMNASARTALDAHLRLFDEPTRVGLPPPIPPAGARQKRVLEGILVVEEDPQGGELRLRSAERVIGRDPRQVDFVVDHPSVSRRHAYVEMHQGRHVITDLGSTNGISFRGRKVHSLVLKDGMVMKIGEVQLQYLVTRSV